MANKGNKGAANGDIPDSLDDINLKIGTTVDDVSGE